MSLLRKIIELTFRGKYFKRCLPASFNRVQLYVSPDAQLKYLKPGESGFDKILLDLAELFVTKDINSYVVWDIGANVGIFSFACAGRGASVIAVEPDPFLFKLLNKSIKIPSNSNLDVQVLQTAVSDRIGYETLNIAKRGRASNCLESAGGRTQMGGVREKIRVPLTTLDEMLKKVEAPNFIKIDVEGAEVNVLEGAKTLLMKYRPTLFIEADVNTRPAVTEILRRYDYLLFDSIESYMEDSPIEGIIEFKETLCIPSRV